MNIALQGLKVAGKNSEIATSPEKARINNIFSFAAAHIACIIILGLAVYSNTFTAPFVFDDTWNITENPAVRDISYFLNPDKLDSSPRDVADIKEGFRSRLFGYLTFALNYKIHGLEVGGYHSANLLIHIFNSLLVYLLVLLTFRTPFQKRRTCLDPSFDTETGKTIACFCALLFVAHPLQTQAVTYIVQRFASLATLLCLSTLVFYIKARLSEQSLHRRAWFFAAIVSVVLAMKTKESSFTFPVIIIIYDFMFLEGSLKKRILFLSPFLLSMAIIPLTMLYSGLSGQLLLDISTVSKETASISRFDYLFTQFGVIATYIRLLFLPFGQNLDYDYTVYNSFFVPQVWLPFLFLLSLFALAIYLLCRSRKEGASAWGFRLISFGILYFFITLSVESSVIPIKDVIFEHRAYLPSFGFFLGVTVCAMLIKNRLPQPFKKAVIPVLFTFIIILASATYARNAVWSNPISLWQDAVNKSPLKARPHNNLGTIYFENGQISEALREFLASIALAPQYPEAHYNLGLCHDARGNHAEADAEFMLAIKLKPDYIAAHNSLGVSLFRQGRPEDAKQEFLNALQLDPSSISTHRNLAVYHEKRGDIPAAVLEYMKIAELDPANDDNFNTLGILFRKLNLFDDARKAYMSSISLKPDVPSTRINLAFIYEQQNRLDEAVKEYAIATRLDPNNAEARFGLGLCYFRKKEFDKAMSEFRAALALDSSFVEARKYIELLSKHSRTNILTNN